jgi:hypothetical protein
MNDMEKLSLLVTILWSGYVHLYYHYLWGTGKIKHVPGIIIAVTVALLCVFNIINLSRILR